MYLLSHKALRAMFSALGAKVDTMTDSDQLVVRYEIDENNDAASLLLDAIQMDKIEGVIQAMECKYKLDHGKIKYSGAGGRENTEFIYKIKLKRITNV